MPRQTFAIITDFGFDYAVASMKGTILREMPNANIIDIDHSIEKFNLANAAFVIEKVEKYMPEDTIFVCVVDPGVGSDRQGICLFSDQKKFIGPNNGIFHPLFKSERVDKLFHIEDENFAESSNTFHGRDIFTPVALQVARGDLSNLREISVKDGNLLDHLEGADIITYIDGFGNIKTNVNIKNIPVKNGNFSMRHNDKDYVMPMTTTFSEVDRHQFLGYKGSNDTLEIAINLGSATEVMRARVGDHLTFHQDF